MAANLGLVIIGVTGMFGLFIAGLAYGAWMTRKVDLKS